MGTGTAHGTPVGRHELHALSQLAAAAKFARRLKIVGGRNSNVEVLAEEDVGHDDDADGSPEPWTQRYGAAAAAADDLTALVGGGNPEHHFVMTEDGELRQRLSRLVAVPLLRFARGRLVLEATSRQDAGGPAPSSADEAPGASVGRKRMRDEGADAPVATSEGGADVSRSPTKKKPKHQRNPNPLSVKKKKKKAASPVRPKDATSTGQPHRRRKKRRSGGLDAEHE